MKTRDLDAELDCAQRNLTTAHHKQLAAIGITFPGVVWRGLVGVQRVELSSDGHRYWPSESGAEAFVTPARIGGNPSSPEDPEFHLLPQYGDLYDLIAWSPKFPGRWATRCDLAHWLGACPPQLMSPPPVRVFRSVPSWLRHDAEGLVLLARTPLDAYRVLSICERIEAEDFAHAGELRRSLEHPLATPRVTVRAPERRAA